MLELRDPGQLASELDLDLERYRSAALLVRMPHALQELADVLGQIAGMLREAEARGQAVDLSDDVVGLIRRFRGALATVGGAPARACSTPRGPGRRWRARSKPSTLRPGGARWDLRR